MPDQFMHFEYTTYKLYAHTTAAAITNASQQSSWNQQQAMSWQHYTTCSRSETVAAVTDAVAAL
eukprot:16763-Heterococcus_DN1.PRE.1